MTPVFIANALDPAKQIHCDVLIDTGAAGLVLPKAWKDRLGALPVVRTVELETADQRVVPGEVCGPVKIHIEGFDVIFGEGIFMEMHPQDGCYEPLLGSIILGQSRAAVDTEPGVSASCSGRLPSHSTRATRERMARTITQRELRNESGEIMRALDAGETFVVTRNGVPTAELRPIERRRFVVTTIVLGTAAPLARVKAARFFADLDRHLDQRLRHG